MSKKTVAQFCKQVGKRLQCSPATRKMLLQGLANELSELPDADKLSIAKLEEKVGKISEIAEELQETVPAEDRERAARRKQLCIILIAGVLLAAAVVLFIMADIYFKNAPYYIVDTIYEG